jgi:hypothetical protein
MRRSLPSTHGRKMSALLSFASLGLRGPVVLETVAQAADRFIAETLQVVPMPWTAFSAD